MGKRISETMKAVHKQESLDRLRKILVNGQEVYQIEVSRVRTNMSARYKFYVPESHNEYDGDVIANTRLSIRNVTMDVAQVAGYTYHQDSGTVKIEGCGLNRPQHLLDGVAYALRPEGGKYGDFTLRERSL